MCLLPTGKNSFKLLKLFFQLNLLVGSDLIEKLNLFFVAENFSSFKPAETFPFFMAVETFSFFQKECFVLIFYLSNLSRWFKVEQRSNCTKLTQSKFFNHALKNNSPVGELKLRATTLKLYSGNMKFLYLEALLYTLII